jgi:MFS transporter, DHA1 family, multidrug resistance protein
MKLKPTSFGFTLLLASLAATPPMSTDLFLPALPVIGQALGGTPASGGYTISIFLASFAFSQLVFGPLSDRFGRRPVGLGGCALFAVAGIGCTLAHSMPVLLGWRLVQGIGAGAAAVLAFAIVRDLFTGSAVRVRLAYVNATVAFAPMLAPTIGALVYRVAGWRATCAVLAIAGVAMTVAVLFGFAESLDSRNRSKLSVAVLLRNYSRVVSQPSVLGYCLLNTFHAGVMLAHVAGSPFVYINLLGVSRAGFGGFFFLTAAGIMAGASLAGALSKRAVADGKVVAVGLSVNLLATCSLLALSLSHRFSLATAVPLLIATTFSIGLVAPSAAHGVLAPLADMAGTAAAAMGCLRMLGGAIASALVPAYADGTATPMTAVMALGSALAAISYVALARRFGPDGRGRAADFSQLSQARV